MLPQLIYIALILTSLVLSGYRHGKDKKGKYNLWADLIAMALMVGLLYWGGFFDPIIIK